MPDISMCSGEGCVQRDRCYRATAIPEPRRQSFFAKPPLRDNGSCPLFMDTSKIVAERR